MTLINKHQQPTCNIANGGGCMYSKFCSPHQRLQRWIGTKPANRHLPYCQTLVINLKETGLKIAYDVHILYICT